MMFQAYQHYFDQKGNTPSGEITGPSIRVQGNQARRGYRPLTGVGS